MNKPFVSRAGVKLDFALDHFTISLRDKVVADFGCSTGGFVDCMLRRGASKVYAVDVAYGELNYGLRLDKKVVVLERTNALFVQLPELVDFISIDVGWTKQEKILPNALKNLKPLGSIVSLIKPHYETQKFWKKLTDDDFQIVLAKQLEYYKSLKEVVFKGFVESPIKGERGNNREFLVFLTAK